MFWDRAYKAGRVIGPVCIHYLIENIVIIIGVTGLHIEDAALLTTATAVLALPLFLWMYHDDVMFHQNGHIGWVDYIVLITLGIFCNLVLTISINRLIFFLNLNLSNVVQETLFQSNFLIQLVGLGVLAPIMEETLFRGLVYNRLRGYTKTAWPAIVMSAAVFAVWHGNVRQMLFAFPMGMILAYMFYRKQTLKAPIIFHMAVNVSSVLFTALGRHL